MLVHLFSYLNYQTATVSKSISSTYPPHLQLLSSLLSFLLSLSFSSSLSLLPSSLSLSFSSSFSSLSTCLFWMLLLTLLKVATCNVYNVTKVEYAPETIANGLQLFFAWYMNNWNYHCNIPVDQVFLGFWKWLVMKCTIWLKKAETNDAITKAVKDLDRHKRKTRVCQKNISHFHLARWALGSYCCFCIKSLRHVSFFLSHVPVFLYCCVPGITCCICSLLKHSLAIPCMHCLLQNVGKCTIIYWYLILI